MTMINISSVFPSQSLNDISQHMFIESIPYISPDDILYSNIDNTLVKQIGPHSYLNYVNWASLYDDKHITYSKKLPFNQYFKTKTNTNTNDPDKLLQKNKQKKLAKLVSKKINRNRLNKYNV